ncbi:TPA: hypothetical protein QCX23_005446 [Bacillus toyonensis]|uniref:hypothetical protein n=1 Tax=Bacillus wiedmannii TaxID=1890302 RepID=UPI00077AA66B|nr:hypothetical protein [Bacillus wiedmannii]KXY02438.1 hypothetical protein AT260_20925 [Bacillus wiedmannii]HDR7398071.1 hypothetical protein [Bacillus toyonensis]
MNQKVVAKDDLAININDIELSPKNLEKIRKKAKRYSLADWRNRDNKEYIEVHLDEDEKNRVIALKNSIMGNQDAFKILLSNSLKFSDHGDERVVWRIEGKETPYETPDLDTQKSLVEFLRDAGIRDLSNKARWKGRSGLNYNFNGVLNNDKLTVSIGFEGKVLIIVITVIVRNKFEFPLATRFDEKTLKMLNAIKRDSH